MKKTTHFKTSISANTLPIWIIALFYLIFAFFGISQKLSYWNDESHVALFARNWLDYGRPITNTGFSTGIYQVALYAITAISFLLFGVNEFAGRLPSVIAGGALIVTLYFFSKSKLGQKQALVVAFLSAFLQIQLAWSTQLRPYVWLQLLSVLVIWALTNYWDSRSIFGKQLYLSVILAIISGFFHGTGLVYLAIISFLFFCNLIRLKKFKLLLGLPVFLFIFILLFYLSFSGNIEAIKYNLFHFSFSLLHYRIFLTHNYLWLIVGSVVGFIAIYKQNKFLALLLSGSATFIFAVAIFKINPNYVRYSLPAFPLLYLLFSAGLVSIISRLTTRNTFQYLLLAISFFLLSLTHKLIFWPQYYYSINADVRENPILDYKTTFEKIGKLMEGKSNTLIIDSWNDRVPWYLPDQKFVMTNYATPKGIDPVFGEEFIGSVEDVKNQIKKHSSGVVIVEDWQSFMDEDIKDYVRKNLKYEFTTQDLPYNSGDHWGVSVYSWGI